MHEKLGSYSLWGNTEDFWRGDVGTNKQAYDTHECFLLIIPEVILQDYKDQMKLHQ